MSCRHEVLLASISQRSDRVPYTVHRQHDQHHLPSKSLVSNSIQYSTTKLIEIKYHTAMSTTDNTFKEKNIIIFDGGTGREIERCHGPFRQPEWSALALYEDPAIVQHVHESFLQAGATAITTNSYAIVPFHIGQERYQKDGKRLLKLSIQLANQARQNYQDKNRDNNKNNILILGGIPPICGSYEPDLFNEEESGPILQDFLDEFLSSPAAVDVLLLETVGSLCEATFYLDRIHQRFDESAQKIPIWLSFCVKAESGSLDQKPQLLSGESIIESIQTLATNKNGLLDNVEVILINCCDVRLVDDSIHEIQIALNNLVETDDNNKDASLKKRNIQIGTYPNAFSIPPPDAANQTLRKVDFNISPAVMKCNASKWIESGATVIGGCCGVNPHHIRVMASLSTSPKIALNSNIEET